MHLLATLMASIALVTTALFAYALVNADEQPAPSVVHVASR
jgi:hypothetical protein